MKRWLAVVLLLAWAWAAPVATLYDQLAPTLTQVQSLQSSNPVKALNLLTDAENKFREGGAELAPQLRNGVLQSLADAKQALSRKSSADLEARIGLIRAILGKALYDSYFVALSGGKAQEAATLLPRVLSASRLPGSLKAQADTLAAANNVDGLRRLFERTYAQGILSALQRAQAQSSSVQAYLEATRAYSLYLVVQDSPRARGLSAKAFVDALGKLSSGNFSGFKSDVKGLTAQAQGFLDGIAAQSKRSNPTATATNPPKSGGVRPQVGPQQGAKPAAPKAQPATPKPTQTAKPQVVQAKPQQNVIKPAPEPTSKPSVRVEPPPFLAAAQGIEDPYQRLMGDLKFLIKDPQKAERVADSLSGAGIYSIDDWRRALLELRGRLLEAQVQAEGGQGEAAKRTLAQINSRYQVAVQPMVKALNPNLANRTTRIFTTAQNAVGLRTSDFTVLSGELLDNGLVLEGKRLGFFHDLQVWVLQSILGIPRAFLFILAGMLAFFPLYLLTLTFGGRNIYWRYLGLAFFFLLLPAMMEGLSYIGSILADSKYGRIPILGLLTNLSIQQNLIAQLFWGFTVFLVVAFATAGLRGIAAQFGLLQNQRSLIRNATRNPTQPQAQPARAAMPNPGLTSETIVEWDEEF